MELLTVREAAERLHLSISTIRSWIHNRKLASVKLGKAIRVPVSALEEIIKRGYCPAKTE